MLSRHASWTLDKQIKKNEQYKNIAEIQLKKKLFEKKYLYKNVLI